MTPTDFRAALSSIGWTQRGLADRLGCDDRLVRRWASGAATVPPAIAAWLLHLAQSHTQAPAPEDWRRRDGVKPRSPDP